VVPAVVPRKLAPSPALSIVAKDPKILRGRKAGILITDGFDSKLLAALKGALRKERARFAIVAPKIGGATGDDGILVEADFTIAGGPSFFFDTVALLPSAEGCEELKSEACAVNWIRDAFAHLKVIGFSETSLPLLDAASITKDDGVVKLGGRKDLASYIETAKQGRRWEREPALRSIR
jgi:catalase